MSYLIHKESKFYLGVACILVLCALTVGACTRNNQNTSQLPADNTGINTRDDNITQNKPDTQTPENQHENEVDLQITQKIRQEIVADDSLSINAKNIKIITANGQVTLRGPVNTEQESTNVVTKAKRVAGADKVSSQLEIVVH